MCEHIPGLPSPVSLNRTLVVLASTPFFPHTIFGLASVLPLSVVVCVGGDGVGRVFSPSIGRAWPQGSDQCQSRVQSH